jgi:hypothetical protein
MEYATEVLDWLKKQQEVAADRYKRCPAGDPSSFTYSAEAKVLGRIVKQLGPLVYPAFVADCGSAPTGTPLQSIACSEGVLKDISGSNFDGEQAPEGYWITAKDGCVHTASRPFEGLLGIPTTFREGKRVYLSLDHALLFLQDAVHKAWHDFLRKMFLQLRETMADDKRIRAKRYAKEVYDQVFGSAAK